MKIGIVGLGLIGGSLAKSTKVRTQHEVLGVDINEETMLLARLSGALDAPLSKENIGECNLLFLALRPGDAVAWLKAHAAAISTHTVVIDLCGVKRAVCEQLEPLAEQHGFTFVGGHPMAGSERGGFTNARDSLFAGASMILTPPPDIGIRTLENLKNYFLDVGFTNLTVSTPSAASTFFFGCVARFFPQGSGADKQRDIP